MLRYTTLGFALILLVATAVPLHAQDEQVPEGARLEVTRAELHRLLTVYEEAAAADTSSREVRRRARVEAELIRQRLEEGDFRVGDRVVLQVEGETELSNTYPVRSGRRLLLPVVGEVSLDGVLRSELESHLTEKLGHYLKGPEIRAQSLIRLGILGEVSEPGFYSVPADALVTDALMMAGGPTGTADVSGLAIQRSGDDIWSDDPLQRAVDDGRTLDQLNLRAGDRIRVPAESDVTVLSALQIARWALMVVPSVVLLGSRIF